MDFRYSTGGRRLAAAGLLLTATLVFAAAPAGNEKIAVAKASVQRAEQAGAPEFAPVELAASRDKLLRADAAVVARKVEVADRLADEANVDAQLAEAIALREKSHKAAVNFDAGMNTLRQESNRPTQQAQ